MIAPETGGEEDRPVALLRLVDDHHLDARAGHARLRKDINVLDEKVEGLERDHTAHAMRLTKIELEPAPELSKLTFSWPTFVFVAGTLLTAAGSQWALGASQRAGQDALVSDVRNILTQMSARKELDAVKETMQSERAASWTAQLVELRKQQEMQALKLENLAREILKRRQP